jgi:transposase
MMLIEGCVRRMKTTGLQTRPLYHWRPHRLIAHVKLCVLALLLERVAEIRCQQTWRTIRHTLEQLTVVRYRSPCQLITCERDDEAERCMATLVVTLMLQ